LLESLLGSLLGLDNKQLSWNHGVMNPLSKKPVISIIIPIFDAEKIIGACLDALFNQTVSCELYEVIVVDDGSEDKSGEAASRYKEVKVLHQKHANAGSARNLGIKHARGDIILFIDADCVAQDNWIEEMTSPFHDPTIAAVKGRYLTRQSGLIARLVQLEFEERYRKMAKFEYTDFVDSYSAAFRKEVLEETGGFNPALSMSEDAQLSYALSKRGYKMVFNQKAIVYHKHPDSIWKYFRVKFWRSYWRMVVYEEFPYKALQDSYTPQTLKLQILLFYISLISAFVFLSVPQAIFVVYVSGLLFLVTCLPIIFSSIKKDALTSVFLPFFLWLRSVALGFGIIGSFITVKSLQELTVFVLLAFLLVISSFLTGGRELVAKSSILILTFPLVFFTPPHKNMNFCLP